MPSVSAADPVFPSRIDAWLAAVVLLAVLSPLAVVAVQGAGSGAGQALVWAMALLPLLVGGLLLLPCRYTLAGDHLQIRCGLIRQRIAYRDITGIAPSRSILSAPALSLQRVKVSYRRGRGLGFQLVSPRERERFMRALQQRVDGAAPPLGCALAAAGEGLGRPATLRRSAACG
jgi:hypothetical protein